MRAIAALLLVLGACATPTECVLMSDVRNTPLRIVSGTSVAGVTWVRETPERELHAAILGLDGSLGPDIALANDRADGTAGTDTILWSTDLPCGGPMPFTVGLQRGGVLTYLTLADDTVIREAVFDGTRYQLFYKSNLTVNMRSLDEDGTLGPERSIAGTSDARCIDAVPDDNGAVFVRFDNEGYMVDTTTGERRLVFSGPDVPYGSAFYFAGEFHIPRPAALLSVTPMSRGGYATRAIGALNVAAFRATPGRLFARNGDEVVELDSTWTVVNRRELALDFGTLAGDLIHFEHHPLDAQARLPARIDLVRQSTPPVQTAVTVDSEVRDDHCDETR